MNQEKTQKTKVAYLEFIRVIASFLVIVNHTNSGIFLSRNPGVRTWWVSIVYFFISKTAVPLFLMISGALLLGVIDEPSKYIKRVVRIVADIVVFSFMIYAYGSIKAGKSMDIIEFLKRIVQQHMSNAYWYLYLYLGILLMLPLLQRLSVKMGRNAYRYLILLSVVFLGGMPILTHYFPGAFVHAFFSEAFFSVYVGIVFLGYYLAHEVELKNRYAAISVLVFVVGIAFQAYATSLEYQKNPQDYLFYDERTFLTVTLTAASLFYLARWLGSVIHASWFWKAVTFLGGCSFGIYLFADLFIDVYAMIHLELLMRMHALKAVLIYELLVFFSGAAVTAVLKKIPYINKLL